MNDPRSYLKKYKLNSCIIFVIILLSELHLIAILDLKIILSQSFRQIYLLFIVNLSPQSVLVNISPSVLKLNAWI